MNSDGIVARRQEERKECSILFTRSVESSVVFHPLAEVIGFDRQWEKEGGGEGERGGAVAKIKIAEVSFPIRLTSECLDLISRIPDVQRKRKNQSRSDLCHY